MNQAILKVESLKKHFPVGGKKVLKAVDNVNFTIFEGETLGLVGESGCGKTTCGRAILNLYPITDGKVLFQNNNINNFSKEENRAFRKNAQMIFQDPYSSLNPRMTIFESIAEGLRVHFDYSNDIIKTKVKEVLLAVGLTDSFENRFPHELSGGQCQRVGIARALVVDPDLIVCDEPISALDVSIQAQIVNLLIKLQEERNLAYLFISHDLSMVKHISHRIGVMYLGSLVEICDSEELFQNTLHPYTQLLMSAIPDAEIDDSKKRERIEIIGEVPSPIDPPPGCKFSNRCVHSSLICSEQMPDLEEVSKGHFVACHHHLKFVKS